MTQIDKKYKDLSSSSRKARFTTTNVMEPIITGVRRSLTIPPYTRKQSASVKACAYKLDDINH